MVAEPVIVTDPPAVIRFVRFAPSAAVAEAMVRSLASWMSKAAELIVTEPVKSLPALATVTSPAVVASKDDAPSMSSVVEATWPISPVVLTVSDPLAAMLARRIALASVSAMSDPVAETPPVKSFASVSVIAFPALAMSVPPAMSSVVPAVCVTAPEVETCKFPACAADPATATLIVVSALALVATSPKLIPSASATEISPPVAAKVPKLFAAFASRMS